MIDPSNINWDRAFDVLNSQKIPDWDKELVAIAVEKAVRTWTATVDKGQVVRSTEILANDPFPHKIDIVLEGERLKIVDWKTKKAGKLDESWTLKQARSWQPRLYAAAAVTHFGYDVFPILAEIRGIVLAEKPEVRTIPLILTRTDAERAYNYLRMVESHRAADLSGGVIPWIQDPQGCRPFGPAYKCEFEGYCWPDAEGNVIHIPVGDMTRADKTLSHSGAQEYLRCPERYRLLRVLDKEDDDDSITGSGNAFHAVMEQIYSQLKLVSDETTR